MDDNTVHLRALNLQLLPVINFEEDEKPSSRRASRTSRTKISVSRDLPKLYTGMEEKEESEKHLQEIIGSSVPSEIPIPNVRPVADYEQSYKRVKQFNRPQNYIEYNDTMTEGLGHLIEYDLDDEDIQFLQEINEEQEILTDDKFEFIVDMLEKESFYNYNGEVPSFQDVEQILRTIPLEIMTAVYSYWKNRRMEGHPLIPRFSLMRSDLVLSSPYSAFRTHKDQFKKKHRRNDLNAFVKMRKLRQEMEKSRLILETIIKREKEKRQLIEVLKETTDLKILEKQIKTAPKTKTFKPKGRPKKNAKRSHIEKQNVDKIDILETSHHKFDLSTLSSTNLKTKEDDYVIENATSHHKKPLHSFASKLYFTC